MPIVCVDEKLARVCTFSLAFSHIVSNRLFTIFAFACAFHSFGATSQRVHTWAAVASKRVNGRRDTCVSSIRVRARLRVLLATFRARAKVDGVCTRETNCVF